MHKPNLQMCDNKQQQNKHDKTLIAWVQGIMYKYINKNQNIEFGASQFFTTNKFV